MARELLLVWNEIYLNYVKYGYSETGMALQR